MVLLTAMPVLPLVLWLRDGGSSIFVLDTFGVIEELLPGERNNYTFNNLLSPAHACKLRDGSDVYLTIYVHTAPTNFKKRQGIRQTWGDPDLLWRYNAILVFIMGRVEEKPLMDLVRLESDLYDDIVQEDFLDSYRNLTYKAIVGLKWVSTYCSNTTFVLKTDDDVLVNIHKLVQYIRTSEEPLNGSKGFLACYLYPHAGIQRDKKSKWYIPESEFPGTHYFPYCAGLAFLISVDVAKCLYEASMQFRFFWVDDVYITGVLVRKLGIEHRQLNNAYLLSSNDTNSKDSDDAKQQLIFVQLDKPYLLYRLWRNLILDNPAPIKSPLLVSPLAKTSKIE